LKLKSERRNLLKVILFSSLFALGTILMSCSHDNSSQQTSNQQPNIILILADDLGYGDLGCYGSQRIETPAIDQMAQEGKKLTQFYAGSAVCTPTRVSIMTGRYPLRFNVSTHFNDQEMHLQAGVPTLARALSDGGYITKHIGKWHLGGLNEKHVQQRESSIPGPIQHGFDHYLAMYEDPLYRKPAMLEDRLYKDAARHLVRDEQAVESSDEHWTDYKTNEAIDFIKSAGAKDQPFYLNLWYDAPHAPYEAAPGESFSKYSERAKGKEQKYRSMVSHLDYSVGRILSTLKSMKLDKNTLVIFTSDNGPAYLGSNGGFKGRKLDFHEGGIRVPAIAWWPGMIKEKTISHQLAHTNDLFPTFCAVANIPVKDTYQLDGFNIWPLFQDNSTVERGYTFWQIMYKKKNYNYGLTSDAEPEPKVTEVVRDGKWKLLARDGKAMELYNLDEDCYEQWNLLKDYPERVKLMEAALNEFLNEPRLPKPY
jgi:N-acetylgalactosamine-6-sulfatase